jgi:sarcosine oxidase, subunit delta
MVLLPCPWCGQRNVSEFHYLGEPSARPDPANATQKQWREYLYFRDNRAGWVTENWFHRAGCRRFFSVERDNTTNEVRPVSAATEGGQR